MPIDNPSRFHLSNFRVWASVTPLPVLQIREVSCVVPLAHPIQESSTKDYASQTYGDDYEDPPVIPDLDAVSDAAVFDIESITTRYRL